MVDMVHSRKEGLVHSGLTASIPGGDEAGGAGHTPGSWMAAAKPSSIVGWPVVARPMGRAICNISYLEKAGAPAAEFNAFYNECEANARLIAAAPELLEACLALAASPLTNTNALYEAKQKARAAISKAVGDVKRDPDPIHRRDGDEVGVNQASLPSQSEVG